MRLRLWNQKKTEDFEKLRETLDEYPELVHMHGADEVTLLMKAAFMGDIKTGQLLLDYGADINGQTSRSFTVLDGAVLNDHKPMVEFLLDRGVDITKQDGDTLSFAIMEALANMEENDNDIANLLVARGIDVNAPTSVLGYTALMFASAGGHMDIVQLLIKKGANVNGVTSLGETALGMALLEARLDIGEYLLEKGAVMTTKELKWLMKDGNGAALMPLLEIMNKAMDNSTALP